MSILQKNVNLPKGSREKSYRFFRGAAQVTVIIGVLFWVLALSSKGDDGLAEGMAGLFAIFIGFVAYLFSLGFKPRNSGISSNSAASSKKSPTFDYLVLIVGAIILFFAVLNLLNL